MQIKIAFRFDLGNTRRNAFLYLSDAGKLLCGSLLQPRPVMTLITLVLGGAVSFCAAIINKVDRRFRPTLLGPAVLFDGSIGLLLFANLIGITARPLFSGVLVILITVAFTFADQMKRKFLREPIVFTDAGEIVELFLHPELYVPFLGKRKVVGCGVLASVLLMAAFYAEEPSFKWNVAVAVGVPLFTVALALVLGQKHCIRGVANISRSMKIGTDAKADIVRLGPLLALSLHSSIAKDERASRQARCAPKTGNCSPKNETSSVVVVQCESFFDARRLGLPVSPDLLANFERCRSTALSSGRLLVPSWGANTARTEFSVLTGLSEQQTGLDYLNPYAAFAHTPIESIAWGFKRKGYETVFLHPFDLRFYQRSRAIPNFGFDVLIDQRSFAMSRPGEFVSDVAVGEFCRELLVAGNRAAPVFLFVVTIDNHGPWDAARSSDQKNLEWPLSIKASRQLEAYLDGLARTDKMIGMLADATGNQRNPGTLCVYGDHVPSLTKVFDETGFSETSTDYFMWRAGTRQIRERHIAAQEFGDLLNAVAG